MVFFLRRLVRLRLGFGSTGSSATDCSTVGVTAGVLASGATDGVAGALGLAGNDCLGCLGLLEACCFLGWSSSK